MKTKRQKSPIAKIKKKTTRVTVDFPVAVHRKLKALAALEGVTLQDYIRSRVTPSTDISNEELDPIVKNIIDENEDTLKRLANK